MGNMMNITGMDYGFLTLWGLHVLSVIAFFTGVLFLVVLAIKTFNAKQLKIWAIWLMVVGTIVCLFTIAMVGRPWIGFGFYGHRGMGDMQMQMMGRMMEEMQEHDRGAGKDDQEEHGGMMEMMRTMMGSPKAGGGMMNASSSS